MRLYLDVTWPICKTIGPLQRSSQLVDQLLRERTKLRHDLVRDCGDGLCIQGLFGCENKVPDVDRYLIERPEQPGAGRVPSRVACEIAVTEHQIGNAAPTQPAAGDHRPPFVSTHPYVDRKVVLGCDQPTLVIVLESPHRDEYDCSVEAPIAPARGKTGARIHKYLCMVLNSCTEMRNLLFDNAPVTRL